MKTLRVLICVFWGALSPAAIAGTPINDAIQCPIAPDELVLVVSTASCTTFGLTMSLRQSSSCDFLSRLPTCQAEDFPIYTEFEDGDLADIAPILAEQAYQDLRTSSRYLRAYHLDMRLNLLPADERVWLLQAGHFYDPDHTYGEPAYLAAFELEAARAMETADAATLPALLAMVSFARFGAGDLAGAQESLDAFRKVEWQDGTIWEDYAARLAGCIANDSDECRPDATFIQR